MKLPACKLRLLHSGSCRGTLPLVAGLQRMAVLLMQSALGMMVWLAISRRMWVWLGAALAWQTAMNTLSVILAASMPDLGTIALYILIGVVNGAILVLLYKKTGAAQEVIPALAPAKGSKKPSEQNIEHIFYI